MEGLDLMALNAQKRIGIFLILMLFVLVILGGRIAWIQFVEGSELVAKAKMQLADKKELHLPRGTIYDRNGRELAVSRMAKSLYANIGELNKDADIIASLLSPVLDMQAKDIK
jgi:stage V sporulation protein D (sporulation-specific penicillin-binding protein)